MLLATLLALGLAGSPSSVWPQPETCKVLIESSGAFSARGDDPVNAMNAAAGTAPPEPAPLDLSPAVIAAWNAGLARATDDALRDLHLTPARSKSDVDRVKRSIGPATGTADRYFNLKVEVSPENRVGGHAAGNAVRVTLSSLHRATDLVGSGATTVLAMSELDAPIALRAALVAAITEAFADFKTHLGDESTRPRAHLSLQVALDGLTPAQRTYAVSSLIPCAAKLAEPISTTASTLGTVVSVDIEYRLRRFEATETENSFLTGFAGRLSFEIGPNGKNRCSTWQTPLEHLDAHVSKDEATQRVAIRFTTRPGE